MNFDKDLHIRKAPHGRIAQRQTEFRGNGFSQREVAVTSDDLHGC
jgi:hypothetical protein